MCTDYCIQVDQTTQFKELSMTTTSPIIADTVEIKPTDEGVRMRHVTGFGLFRSEEQERMKIDADLPSTLKTQMPLISANWKSMSDACRDEYKQRAHECDMVPTKPSRKRKTIALDDTSVCNDVQKDKKKRKKRDPSLPKRPKSSFIFFSCVRRGSLSAEYPNLKPTEVLKAIGKEWGQLENREPFAIMATQDKERYDNEMLAHVEAE